MPRTLLVAQGVHTLGPQQGARARALLVHDRMIAWVGSDPAQAPAHDRTIDLGTAWITPAMVDAHVHATMTGLALNGVDLGGCASLAEATDRIRRHADLRTEGVIDAVGWDHFGWPEGRTPTSDDIAAAAPGRTVLMVRVDGHSCVVDPHTLARLDLDGVDGVARTFDGQPTGYLREQASHLAMRAVRGLRTRVEIDQARAAVCTHAAARGIGSFHEMGHPGLSELSDALTWASEDWPVDVQVWWADFGPWLPEHAPGSGGLDARAAAEAGLRPGGDLFLDGSIGSHTAAVDPPYLDTGGSGELFHDDETVRAFFAACTAAGVGAGVHAIGDRAISQAARALAAVAGERGVEAVRRARHRIEHVELPPWEDLVTLGRLGVTASVQPVFDAMWGGTEQLYAGRFGVDRAVASNPFRALHEHGLPLAFGSDSTVTPMGPAAAMRAATSHLGGHGIPPALALRAHTLGGRYVAGQDGLGPLAAGAGADLAVWAADPIRFEEPPGSMVPDPPCLATMVAGHLVHGSW